VVRNVAETGNAKCFFPPILALGESFNLTIRHFYERVQFPVSNRIAHQPLNPPLLGVVFIDEVITLILPGCLVKKAGYRVAILQCGKRLRERVRKRDIPIWIRMSHHEHLTTHHERARGNRWC